MKVVEANRIKRMVRNILTARPDEIACDECLAKLDSFVEMELDGRHPAEAMPLVQDHLERCRDCHEEYKALLVALETASEN